jgi:hypothetical protein
MKQAPYSSTRPRWSPTAKVSRIRALPTKVSSRRLSYDYGWSFRGKPLLEDVDGIDPVVEYESLVELGKLHGNEGTGFCGARKQHIIRSCISSPHWGLREKIIYEEDDDFVGTGNAQQTADGSWKASPGFSSPVTLPIVTHRVSLNLLTSLLT